MTKEDLTNYGYIPRECKVGTLYFKDCFFGKLDKDGVLDFRKTSDDMHTIGKVSTIKELKELEKQYYVEKRGRLQLMVELLNTVIKSYEKGDS